MKKYDMQLTEENLVDSIEQDYLGRNKKISKLIDILNSFNIEVEYDKILDSLMKLKGKKVYLLKIPDYENKYQVLKDYNEVN